MSGPPATRLPWSGQPERSDKIILSAIVLAGLYSLATLPLVPWMLVHHPVALAVLRGGMSAIVNLGALARVGQVPPAAAVLLAVPAMVAFDWAYWWAGRRWGERGLTILLGDRPRAAGRVRRARRLATRWKAPAVLIAYFQPLPNFFVYAAAGWAGLPLGSFLVLDVAGTVLWTGLLAGLGYGIGRTAVDAVEAFAGYSLWVTLGLVVIVVARQIHLARRR